MALDERERLMVDEDVDDGAETLDSVEVENKILEDAIAEGLARLRISRGEAEIEVLDEGKGGFLGIGSKKARVRVSRIGARVRPSEKTSEPVLDEIIEKLTSLLDDTTRLLEVRKEGEGRYLCELDAENIAIVLGRRGKTLDAIQCLATALAAKRMGDRVRITLDARGFRRKRREALTEMAHDAADDARKYKEKIHLDPMSAHDRKIIHSVLANSEHVTTQSEDNGDRRHVVVVPKEAGSSRGGDRAGREGRGRSQGRSDRGRGDRGRSSRRPRRDSRDDRNDDRPRRDGDGAESREENPIQE